MEYLKFYDSLKSITLITPIWKEILLLLDEQIDDTNDKDDYLILFAILFSLNEEGNACMSLDKDTLLKKWNKKLEGTRILLEGIDRLNKEAFTYVDTKSHEVIERSLDKITKDNLKSVINDQGFFDIDDGWLYLRKHNVARKYVIDAIKNRLFKSNVTFLEGESFDYKETVDDYTLKEHQEEVVTKGLHKNLVITGGPGTGKTTSIAFLLLGLLSKHDYDKIYLLAPSGKAASRMKDSIKSSLGHLKPEWANKEIVERIRNLERSTIHKVLRIDPNTGAFRYNEKQKLNENSIFIVDEASMGDICLFASLLSAIPDDARLFIMGDKDQLPSVDVGAVFGDLIAMPYLNDNDMIVRLTETVRFSEDSQVFKLAQIINDESKELPQLDWKEEYLSIQKNAENDANPVYFYQIPATNEGQAQKICVQQAVLAFGQEHYAGLQERCTGLDASNPDSFKQLFNDTVLSGVILCAENQGFKGIRTINALMKQQFIDKSAKTPCKGFYPGELMMVTKNNKELDLSNGDSGILVTFDGDSTLYFMIEKDSELIKTEGKEDGKIFKLGGYMFYPFNKITGTEIENSYAITIHKSQGSDYKSILVILPTQEGHPLLNRQIVYTAITRTKGDAYILSNQDRLKEAKDTMVVRDTNIK